ncbi:unnamed protein product [Blepharisma stoltei]|uniref:von Willebrand factor A domain-containing protein n=1 Tax=Blepharisma stoltei TaxID=1481888 RepID=A0AAU9I7I7_9CILI|nr:unnamed protein product [Blepharisma stoltei]
MSSLVGTNNEQLILTKFHSRSVIHYNYAEFYIESSYTNSSKVAIEASYVFPSISGMHLSKLSIYTGKIELQLKIEEYQRPLKSYQDAKNAGESDYTLDKLRETNMICYRVGNVLANSQVAIKAVYVCKTEQTLPENYWKFKIPKDLLPNKLGSIKHSAEAFIIWKDFPVEHGNFILKKGNLITLDEKHNLAAFRNFDPNYDIELIYYYEIPKEPLLIVQKDQRTDRYAFHLSYTPIKELNESGNDGEFVILLDRSGSMSSRIKLATEAVALFIRSLPANCYFNVVSFGSRYESMFKKSKKYDKCSADEAHRLVLKYKSDMHGTKLLDPLEYIFNWPRIPGYPLNIFIVTDGNIWLHKKEIVALIKKHKNEVKISTIGIDTNHASIDEFAKLGNGTSQHVYSENQIKPAILSSLKQALAPMLSNIQLSDYDPFDFVLPKDPFSIFSGEKVEISGVFKKRKLPRNIKLLFENEGLPQSFELEINGDLIPASCSVLLLEAKEYLNRCYRQTSVKKSKEYLVEGQFTSFNTIRYKKKESPVEIKSTDNAEDMQHSAIDLQKTAQNQPAKISQRRARSGKTVPELTVQTRSQVKRAAKKSAPKQTTPKRAVSAITTTQADTPITRSSSKLEDVSLQTKRGRAKQAKVIPPRKKAKVEKDEAKIKNIEIKPIENKEKEAISDPRPQESKEVKCIDVGYEVEKIMHLQNPDGFWECSRDLLDIAINLLDYDNRNYWTAFDENLTTAFIVALLNEKCEDYKCLWELVVMKAKKWLSKNKQRLLSLADF